MDTNWKTSKCIRHFLYRIFFFGFLFLSIVYCYAARNGLNTMLKARSFDFLLHGNFWEDEVFLNHISDMYNSALIGAAGIGDDLGEPLFGNYNKLIEINHKSTFSTSMNTFKEYSCYIASPNTYRNTFSTPVFSEADGHLIIPSDKMLLFYWDGKTMTDIGLPLRTPNSAYRPSKEGLADSTFVLMLSINKDTQYQDPVIRNAQYRIARERRLLIVFLTVLFLTLVFGLLCLFTCKTFRSEKPFFFPFYRKLFAEVRLLIPLLLFVLVQNYYYEDSYFLYCTFLLGALVYTCFLFPIKVKEQPKCTFALYILMKKSLELIHAANYLKRLYAIILIPVFVIFLLILYVLSVPESFQAWPLFCLMILLLILCFALMSIFAKDLKAIVEKIKSLHEGEGADIVTVSKNSLLKNTADQLNHIEEGIELAVEQRDRSNKMRVDLITNVSHDLKTPLTSIINYADLLAEEKLPEPASNYVLSLQQKAYRLKNMVQDVFDLSKASSGNLSMNLTRLNLVKLIQQTLADMEETITQSTLTFKTSFEPENILITADPDKLYRVFQNLYVNALKYSLEHSRVYTQISVKEASAVVKIRNTAKEEITFDSDEIVERFVRADSSRTEEGSGLGLSIVQSFTESMQGSFHVETDGDLFTAYLTFPLAK